MNKLLLYVTTLALLLINPYLAHARKDTRVRFVKESSIDVRKYRVVQKRPKPKKFIYSAETNEIKSVNYGHMLPSQVTLSRSTHKSSKDGDRMKLRTVSSSKKSQFQSSQRNVASLPHP